MLSFLLGTLGIFLGCSYPGCLLSELQPREEVLLGMQQGHLLKTISLTSMLREAVLISRLGALEKFSFK